MHLLRVETGFLGPAWSDVPLVLNRLYQGIQHEHLLLALIPLHLLAALLVLWFARHPSAGGEDTAERSRIGVLLDIADDPAVAFLHPWRVVRLGAAQNSAIDRYTLSCWFLPALMLLSCCAGCRADSRGSVSWRCNAIVRIPAYSAACFPLLSGRNFIRPYPPLAQELDRLARERGRARPRRFLAAGFHQLVHPRTIGHQSVVRRRRTVVSCE